jgi:hypothetical protein
MRFWVRSSKRDESADASRLGSIERSILNAIADVEKEQRGFKKRIEEARGRAAILMGNETFGELDRDKQSEQLLQASEQALIAASNRMRQLAAHLEHLQRVLGVLRQK